jgi:single-stranded DNA-specific DHH superfamily exonuclease
LLLEASLVAYAAALKGEDISYLLRLVDELSTGRAPHEIPGVVEDAKKQADNALKILSYVRTKGKTMKNIAYVETDETSTGNVANFLIGVFSKPVGVSFREETAGTYEVSLRGGNDCRKHLGNIVADLAKKFGGAGGGHAKASGASILKERMEEFLVALDTSLE